LVDVTVVVENHVGVNVLGARVKVEENLLPDRVKGKISVPEQPVDLALSIEPGQSAEGLLYIMIDGVDSSFDLPITLEWKTSRDGDYPFYLTKHVVLVPPFLESQEVFDVDEASCTRRLESMGAIVGGPPGSSPIAGAIYPQGSGVGPIAPSASFVYVLVMSSIWPSVSDRVWRYVDDMSVTYSVAVWTYDGTSTESVRNWLTSGRLLHSNLVGCLFVGDVPVAWYEIPAHSGWGAETFPIDLYYMDLDGIWIDADMDGAYESHSGNKAPEIWIGRLKASTIGDETQLIGRYFDKNHEYRSGHLSAPNRALSYVDDDWKDSYDRGAVGSVYSDMTLVDDGATTTASDYKNRLALSYEWVHLMCHGWPGGHTFKIGSDWTGGTVESSEYFNAAWPVLFFNFFVCSGARYTESGYLAGSAVFTSTYGLLAIGSTKTGSMTNFFEFYRPISSRTSIGSAFLAWWRTYMYHDWFADWAYGLTIIGDPALVVGQNRSPYGAEIVSLGVVPDPSGVDQGSKMTFAVTVLNTGSKDMSSARVQLRILKPGGRVGSSPSKTITRFLAGSTRTIQITYNLPKSAAAGDWTYGVYVYRSSTLLDSETDGGFKVRVPSGVIVSVADSPDPVTHGTTASFTVTIKNTGNLVWSSAKITIKILKPDGKLAKTLTINARNIQPGVEYTYTKDWRIPTRISTSAPIGTYSYNVYLTYGSTPIANSIGNMITVN
jgi:hypothetical protein